MATYGRYLRVNTTKNSCSILHPAAVPIHPSFIFFTAFWQQPAAASSRHSLAYRKTTDGRRTNSLWIATMLLL